MNTKNIKIAISGFSGCGNTTVSNLLAKKLSIPCINYTFRNLAVELNLDFTEIVKRAKTDFSFDKMVDKNQIALARKSSCVLGSRLAIWLLPEATLKVFLLAPFEVRAKRIASRENKDYEKTIEFTKMRDKADTERYKKLYQIDNTDYKFADLIIDTSEYDPEQISNIIMKVISIKCKTIK